MTVTGKIYVYKNQYGLSTVIKNSKNEKEYVSVNLPYGDPTVDAITDSACLIIRDAFLSHYKGKNDVTRWVIKVKEYEVEENNPPQEFEPTPQTDELPF